MPLDTFHPVVRDWFVQRFGAPTQPQRLGWPFIAAGRHTLIAAPTGSGKTLSAFLVCLDQLWRDATAGQLDDTVHVVYISPLKALSNDIERNLQTPLAELSELARKIVGQAPIGRRLGALSKLSLFPRLPNLCPMGACVQLEPVQLFP